VLNAGARIAIYGGSGCQGAHDQVVALADCLKAPVAHTSRAKDFIEYDNPFNVGMTGVIGTAAGYHALMACDTLLLLGCDFAWRQFYPDHARMVQIDIDPTHLGRRHPVEIGVVGDVRATLEALIPRLTPRQDTSFLDDCVKRHEDAFRMLDKRATVGRGGAIHPQYLAHLIDHYAADDAVFTADAGSPMVWLLRHVRATGRRRTILSLTHGTMANAMPQALGAKKAAPNRQVISLSGDGGLSMLLGDLITAIQEKISIKIAVFNNGSLGFVELEMNLHRSRESGFRPRGSGDRILCATGGAGGRTGSSCARLDCRSGAGAVGCRNRSDGTRHAAEGRARPGLRHRALLGQGRARRSRGRRMGTRDRQLPLSHLVRLLSCRIGVTPDCGLLGRE
jgi:pyruvate dehydrogenase (quinone)